jgi:uncharacterized protein
MKSTQFIFRLIILVMILFGLTGNVVFAQTYPEPIGFVNDFAGMLRSETISKLENRLSLLEKDTSAEVTFVSVDNLDGNTLEEYANGLFSAWGIGKKDKDNGVLFLISLAEGYMRIEVGYGLESVITDGRAGRILDNDVMPYFAKNDFDSGVEAGIIAIENYIRDGTPPPAIEENPVQGIIDRFSLPFPLLIGLGVISIYMLGFMARTKSIWLGGVWGFILGIILGFGFGGWVFLIALPLGFAIFGTLLDAILSSNYRGRTSSGRPTGWFSSRGGFSGPSGGFGGFGGFGGGSSGGGGASRHF